MKNFKFVVRVAPDKETIKEFHKILANGLIKKYGAETMKIVLEELKKDGKERNIDV